jgi:hypothetical protein
MWVVRFRDDKNSRALTSQHDSEQAAFEAACSLRLRQTVLSVEGPNGQRYDTDAIIAWCLKHQR